MKNLKIEVEKKMNQFENVYGERKYCISLATEKETLSKVAKIAKLGYTVTKNQYNNYTIEG